MRQTEHVLYITLIDFLLQLLFLGLVVSVIYTIAQQEEQVKLDPARAKAKDAIESLEKIRSLTGISDITILTDELTRLAPLQAASKHADLGRDVEQNVLKVGGQEAANKILDEYATKRGGQGWPSCLPGGAKLAVFHAYADRIELRHPISTDMIDLLKRRGIPLDKASSLSLTEFRKVFSPVIQREPTCRYNVEIIEHSYDTRPRDAVRTAFWTTGLTSAPDRK